MTREAAGAQTVNSCTGASLSEFVPDHRPKRARVLIKAHPGPLP